MTVVLRILNGFDKLSDANLKAKASSIYEKMLGNAAFATPPSLTDFLTLLNSFGNATAVADKGSQNDKDIKNQLRGELIDSLHNLGNYVLFTANGDEVVAKSSGFTIGKTSRTPAPPVVPATGQALTDGSNAGELDYSFDKVAGATAYVYQYTIGPLTESSVWENKTGTVRKVRFSGLPSGQRVWCRVMSLGRKGQCVYSEPVSRIVQ